MASVVDICNLALAHLGDDATIASIDPPEGSAQAEHCARFYPVARDALLEMHAWGFATKRVRLAALSVESWDWAFAYAKPNNIIRTLSVLSPASSADAQTQPYEIEVDTILTDQEDAVLRYTERATDTTKYPPLFVDALTWLLASYLAGTVIKGDAGASMAKSCLQSFAGPFSLAKASDANQRRVIPDHSPSWIGGR